EGGLSLQFRELREATWRVVLSLVTVGTVVTWILSAAAAYWVLGLDYRLAALVGAVLVVTGPTVVAPLLRHIRPSQRVGSIVKWEGIVIDPIGAVLAVLVFEAVFANGVGEAARSSALSVARTILYGGCIGSVTAVVLVTVVKHFLAPDFLQSPMFLAAALGAFVGSNYVQHESGLVAVTVLGLCLANQKTIHVRHIVEFKENLQVLLISCLFIVLGARIDLYSMQSLGWPAVGFIALIILVIRPLAVAAATLGAKLSINERVFLAFLAPRGIVAAAVASVFALELSHADSLPPEIARQVDAIVPITFAVIIGTVAFYGLAAAPIARLLHLSDANPQGVLLAGAAVWIRDLAGIINKEGVRCILVDTNYSNIAAAQMAGIPAQCASILAEFVQEEIDLGGVGRLLAMTPNDEVNALAVNEFSHLFGRKNVYQLPTSDSGSGRRESVSHRLQGRPLFVEQATFAELERRASLGAAMKRTQLTSEFTFEDYQQRYPDNILMFILDDDGKSLHICDADAAREPAPGEVVIAQIWPSEE
ncbi:MAG: sodium:proton antiporter, partial [Pirellulaceae bacterium]|nr:sodium:proton antiporter [Pirellulaceae bacterium]